MVRTTYTLMVNLLSCHDLTVHGTRGIAVGPVSFVAPKRRPVAIIGPAGSGKSTLLLALAGRMRGVRGELEVGGIDGIAHPKLVRQRSAVARIGTYVDVEDTLSLEDCLTERALAEAAKPGERHTRFLHAAQQLGMCDEEGLLSVSMHALVGDLSPLQRTQLCVALTCVRPADYVVIDDVERDLSLQEQQQLWQGFARLSEHACVVIAGTREPAALPLGVTQVMLEENR